MGCFKYGVYFYAEVSRIATADVHRPLLSNCEFCKSLSNESHTLLLEINEFLYVISILIVCCGRCLVLEIRA